MSDTNVASIVIFEPVIEVLPSVLNPDAEVPIGVVLDVDRDAYLAAALAHVGLGDLRVDSCWALMRDVLAIPGATERLVEAVAHRTEQRETGVAPGFEEDDEEDEIEVEEDWVDYRLACGIAIWVDDEVRAWPGCCADWRLLADVVRAVDRAGDERPELWMGHDGSRLRLEAAGPETVTLYTQKPGATERACTIDRAALRKAVDEAWDVIDRFEALARPVIDGQLVGARTVSSRSRYAATR